MTYDEPEREFTFAENEIFRGYNLQGSNILFYHPVLIFAKASQQCSTNALPVIWTKCSGTCISICIAQAQNTLLSTGLMRA